MAYKTYAGEVLKKIENGWVPQRKSEKESWFCISLRKNGIYSVEDYSNTENDLELLFLNVGINLRRYVSGTSTFRRVVLSKMNGLQHLHFVPYWSTMNYLFSVFCT
jgi:hypothetical protein